MYDSNAIEIHIDGSAYKNPGNNGGVAGVVEYPVDFNRKPQIIFKKGFVRTTNQRMELMACVEALRWARKNIENNKASRIIVFSDSQYLCENIYNANFWKRNHWKNKEGRPISNDDLWGDILSLKSKVRCHLEVMKEKGKSSPICKLVDRLAKEAAKSSLKLVDFGYHPGRVARTKIIGGTAALFPAQGQEAIIRVYRNRYMKNAGKYEISFELVSEKENSLIEKYYAYVSKKEESKIHLRQYYKVKFNKKPGYPTFQVIRRWVHSP